MTLIPTYTVFYCTFHHYQLYSIVLVSYTPPMKRYSEEGREHFRLDAQLAHDILCTNGYIFAVFYPYLAGQS